MKFINRKMMVSSLIGMSCLLNIAYAADDSAAGQKILDQQQEQLDELLVDMNNTGRDLYDNLTTKPQGVVESGCLDKIRALDVSVIVIDPMSLLGAVYAALKDQLKDMACSAATDFANKASEELTAKLEVGYGIASLEVDSSGSATGSEGIFKPNVQIDNEKVGNEVTKKVLQGVRSNNYRSSSGLSNTTTKQFRSNNKARNTKEVEKLLENAIDVDKIWGGKAKGDKDESNN